MDPAEGRQIIDACSRQFYNTLVMRKFSRIFLLVFCAVAVFLVSSTCTIAGCLLKTSNGRSAAYASCCERQGDRHESHIPPKKCPLCQGSTLLVKAGDKYGNHGVKATDLQASHSDLELFAFISPVKPTLLLSASQRQVPAAIPPTLLGLHCSLVV